MRPFSFSYGVWRAAAASIALIWGGVALAQSAPETISFAFAPAANERWIRTGEDRSYQDLGSAAPIRETVTIQEVEFLYTQQTDGSWNVRQIPLRAEMIVDGTPQPNLALDLTVGVEVNLSLDGMRKVTNVVGFRKLLRAMEEELPPAAYARVAQSMTEKSLAEGERRRFEHELLDLIGTRVELGEVWRVLGFASFGMGGEIPVSGVIRFAGWTELDGIRAFNVIHEFDSTGQIVAEFGATATRTLNWRDGREGHVGNVEIQGKDIRIIVPSTGQILYRNFDQVSDLRKVPGMEGDLPGMEGHFEKSAVYRWRQVEGDS